MTKHSIRASGLLLLLLFATTSSAQLSATPGGATPIALADQLAEISSAPELSFEKREARIASAVRLAVAAALAEEPNPARRVELAADFAAAGARVDPRFTSVVTAAVLSSPSLAGIEGAAEQIRKAAYAAGEEKLKFASRSNEPTQPDRDSASRRSASGLLGNLPLSGNAAFHLTLNATGTHDDNVYLTEDDTVSDQTYSFSPGIDFTFGQNSLLHGSAAYQLEFLSYRKKTAPSTRLSHATTNLGYRDERLNASVNASYDENYQNTRQTVTPGTRSIFETQTLNIGSKVDVTLSPLTGIGTGASYHRTSYEQSSLIDQESYSIPFSVLYRATPKVDLSVGVDYRREEPRNGGSGAEDFYYNLGAQGAFTAKLSGNLSVGYRTREGKNGLDDSMLGFDAGLGLELTAKSSMSFSATQDFSTSSQGQSLRNSSYSLSFATSLTPQWSANARISYQQIDYGDQLFGAASSNAVFSRKRKDDYWEGGFSASYLYASWLSTAASFTLRSNSSNFDGADFSNSLLSVAINVKF